MKNPAGSYRIGGISILMTTLLYFYRFACGKIVQTMHILHHVLVLFNACTVTGVVIRIVTIQFFC